MIEWIRGHEVIVGWLVTASIVTFLATLIVVPILVARIPTDYFAYRRRRPTRWASQHVVVRVLLRAGKNLLGVVFVVAGVGMLLLPGQGILTIVIGLMLLDFPGKYGLERWLVTRRPVRRSITWLRARAGRPPLQLDFAE